MMSALKCSFPFVLHISSRSKILTFLKIALDANCLAFFVATLQAESEISIPNTSESGMSRLRVMAMQPEPVPKSMILGRGEASLECLAFL